jgi:hypothetical protein
LVNLSMATRTLLNPAGAIESGPIMSSPAGESLSWWYSDYLVGRDVLLLGDVLAPLTPSDEFLSIAQSCGLVESS